MRIEFAENSDRIPHLGHWWAQARRARYNVAFYLARGAVAEVSIGSAIESEGSILEPTRGHVIPHRGGYSCLSLGAGSIDIQF